MPLLIPRIFHRIWIGNAPEPDTAFAAKWLELNPGWVLKTWKSEWPPGPYPFFGVSANLDLIQQSHYQGAEACDLLRYEILSMFGGVYTDLDMEPLKPIEPILGGVSCFVADERAAELGSAIIGCVPKHPLMNAIVGGFRQSWAMFPGDYMQRSGPPHLQRIFASREWPGVKRFGHETFFPYDWNDRDGYNREYPQAIAAHRHAGLRALPPDRRGVNSSAEYFASQKR
jgi:mannosyltransferase OCH1-like enzyme